MRVIGPQKKQIGVLPIREALRIAQSQGLDLVEMAPNTKPPVCKIMNFGKFIYEKQMREKEARRHQHKVSVRQIRFTMKIDNHDYETKLKKMREFLSNKDRVKIVVRLRGREVLHKHRGMELIERLASDIEDLGTLEGAPKTEGEHRLSIQVVFLPLRRKDAKTEDQESS